MATGRRLVVATILDPFSRQAFGPEADLVDLHPETWKVELENARPDLLLVESAWRGDRGSWHDLVQTRPIALVEIVNWCRHHDVSTVFWNKEDPVHYRRYVDVAALFDHVFTTDIECIPTYVRDLHHDRVHVLPFASQPSVCHPIETVERKHAAVFAGSFYAGHTQRNRELFAEIDGTSRVLPVEIYDRNLGTENPSWQWPEPYKSLVVGTLAPEEIDVAYKGYKVALNVNTVTTSQTMLARRAFDLLACGTPVISNFSPSVKVLFGDLVTATSSADEIEAEVRKLLEDSDTTDKRRAVGIRHILRHHTYTHRFQQILQTVTGVPFPHSRPRVGVVATARTPADVRRWTELVQAQEYLETKLVIVAVDEAARAAAPPSGVMLTPADAAATRVGDLLNDVVGVAVLQPEDWYGPYYLEGLVAALSYSTADAVAKLTRYRMYNDRRQLADEGQEHRWSDQAAIPWHRAAVRLAVCDGLPIGELIDGHDGTIPPVERVLGVDRFDFCEGGNASVDVLADLSASLPLRTGARLESILAAEPREHGAELPASAYPVDHVRGKGDKGFVARPSDDGMVVGWVYDDKNTYLRFRQPIPLNEVSADGYTYLRMRSDNPMLGINVSWLDAGGTKLPGLTYRGGSVHRVAVPEGASKAQLYFTVRGEGTALIKSLALSPRDFSPPMIMEGWAARTLVVSTSYPAYDDLYRLAFIHTRACAYRSAGEDVDVFTLTGRRGRREFQGIQVISGGEPELRQLIETGQYDQVLVHALHPRMWPVLREHLGKIGITIWCHGADIQPWWRRPFPDRPETDPAKRKEDSDRRMDLWRDVSQTRPDHIKFVFVSEAFRDQVAADQASMGFGLPQASVHIVHNPVDTNLFRYVPKGPEQRKRILLIRPFASLGYGNDLAVEAINILAKTPWFSELTIRICGDGRLFDEVTAGLSAYENVTLDRRFLSQQEIAELHRDYGVFLVPTRQDTQGVSRDEAMSSGLVPITSDVPAIHEFMSDAEGYIAPYDDPQGLADAICDLYHHPQRFISKSRLAASRVRQTLATSIVVPQELALFRHAARDEATAS